MSISFRKEEEFFTFHDPMQDGKLIDRKTEVRYDPLTGESSRIIFDPGAPFVPSDYSKMAEETSGDKCPFCKENVFSKTPRFSDELVEGGRILVGEAVAFPNLFPYSKHNAVVRMTDHHFVKLDEFTPKRIRDAFHAAHQYIDKVVEFDQKSSYASINWNYLPPSGGSILHPHIHVLLSEHPTNYQATIAHNAQILHGNTGINFFEEIVRIEQEKDERWIGRSGSISYLHAFAPKSHYDFIGVFDAHSFADLTEAHLNDFAHDMQRFFAYFLKNGVESFNLGLFIPLEKKPGERIHVRLIPRMTIGMLDTSDMNVFNYLHGEPLSLKEPEKIAKEVASYFENVVNP